MRNVLVVDAERVIRSTLKERLEYEGYVVDTAQSRDEATGKLERTGFDVMLCDMSLPDKDALEFLSVTHDSIPGLPVIMMSKQNSLDVAVDCIRRGAYDYIAKPIDLNKLLISIRDSLEAKSQNRATAQPAVKENNIVSAAAADSDEEAPRPVVRQSRGQQLPVSEMVGSSKGMVHIKRLIAKVAPSEARVLILGANGTGKELVAHALHDQSPRAAGPFVEVNCAAIPSELIESELFGHEKGAFTSAIKQRKGKFEQADGGTLFLDEIGDMSLSAQAKVLRALQENRVCRVGSDKDIQVNVRVVAATNKNLRHEIELGNFREDLYHRLSVIVVRVPTLKERAEDIPALTGHFIERICAEYGMEAKKIEPAAVKELVKMEWTGNIRELRNVIERLIILSEETITLEDVNTYAVTTF